MKGKFVTFEGGEGVGKTTQLRLVRQYLEEKGVDAIFCENRAATTYPKR